MTPNRSPKPSRFSGLHKPTASRLGAGLGLFTLFALFCLYLPTSVQAGQTITINGDVSHRVAGNGVGSTGDASDLTTLLPATGNSVVINGGTVGQQVFGGYARSDTGTATVTATGNSVVINGGTAGSSVYGGSARSDTGTATATGNSVVINGGTVGNDVYGGYAISTSGTATATGNSVVINGGTVGKFVHGGSAYSNFGTVTATGNSVVINGGTVGNDVYGGYAVSNSGTTTATATGNSVVINGGTVGNDVYGGSAYSPFGTATATATGNSVVINGGTAGNDVSGGYAHSDTGTTTVTATGNSVVINGGTVTGNVFGGSASSDSGTTTATATGNSVVINGGTVGNNVYGGYATNTSATAPATATGNSVTISNSPNLSASTLFGGSGSGSNDFFTDNTLNVWNYTGGSITGAKNFQYYDFALPGTMGHGGTALDAGTVTLGDGSGKQSTVRLNLLGGGTPLQKGDMVTLINATTLNGTATNQNSIVQGRKGISLLYDFQLAKAGNTLTATVAGDPRLNPQTKALAEGRAAGVAFTTQGGDVIAGVGMHAANSSAGQAGGELAAFSAFQGGSSRYNTGSHVDVDGFSLMTGLGWRTPTAYGNLLLGVFFEAGLGTYDSHNSFNGFATVNGHGDTSYTGGGVLGRMEFPLGSGGATNAPNEPFTETDTKTASGKIKTTQPVLYAEASLRTGWAETDFESSDLRDAMGQQAEYDSGSMYYGAHLGLGTIIPLTDALNIDVYTKYFWTHQGSDSVNVVGDPVHFKASNSHRLRGGARLGYDLFTGGGTRFTPYLGAAYEYELDGKAKATTYGRTIDAPDLKGGTGMGELGVTITSAGNRNVSFDFGVQGYTGLREGITGSFQMKFEF